MHGRRCGYASAPSTQRTRVVADHWTFDQLACANSDRVGNSDGCCRHSNLPAPFEGRMMKVESINLHQTQARTTEGPSNP